MAHIFVSHATADKELANTISEKLKAFGVRTWLSFRDIPKGANWDRSIQQAIEDASAVVIVCTPASTSSDYVRAEIEFALDRDKQVVPLIFGQADLPLRWRMRQWLTWDLGNEESSVQELLQALPQSALQQLQSAVEQEDVGKVKALVRHHPGWTSMDYWRTKPASWTVEHPLKGGSVIDMLARYEQNPRSTARESLDILVFFGPIRSPAFASFEEFARPLSFVTRAVQLFAKQTAPSRLGFFKKVDGPSDRTVMVTVLQGRRKDVSEDETRFRYRFLDQLRASAAQTMRLDEHSVRVTISSYDRLLDNAHELTQV